MANLKDCSKFQVHDDYYTPFSAWENIRHLIPEGTVIWEACMLNAHRSESSKYLKSLGFKVKRNTEKDMLTWQPKKWDMVVTNPPYETKLKKQILTRLVDLDKPFIIIMNSMNTFTKYMRSIFKDKLQHLQVITPNGKICFTKLDYETGELIPTKDCSFYCVYLAYKMNLRPDQLWLTGEEDLEKEKVHQKLKSDVMEIRKSFTNLSKTQ